MRLYSLIYFLHRCPGERKERGPRTKSCFEASNPPPPPPPPSCSPLSKNPPRFAIRLWDLDEIFVSKLQLRSRAKFLTLLLFFSSSSLLFLFLLLLLLPHRAGPLRRFTIPNYNDYAHLLRGLTFEPPPPFAARSMSRFWERNSGGNSGGTRSRATTTTRSGGEARSGVENQRVARDPYQSAYPRILDPGGEQPIRGPGLAGRRDSTAPERYIFKTIPPELHLGSSLATSLFLSLCFSASLVSHGTPVSRRCHVRGG